MNNEDIFSFSVQLRDKLLRKYLLVALRKRAGTGAGVPAPSFALNSTYQERFLRDSVDERLENPCVFMYIYMLHHISYIYISYIYIYAFCNLCMIIHYTS